MSLNGCLYCVQSWLWPSIFPSQAWGTSCLSPQLKCLSWSLSTDRAAWRGTSAFITPWWGDLTLKPAATDVWRTINNKVTYHLCRLNTTPECWLHTQLWIHVCSSSGTPWRSLQRWVTVSKWKPDSVLLSLKLFVLPGVLATFLTVEFLLQDVFLDLKSFKVSSLPVTDLPLCPKRCDIGDASRGSLSSYAYILMVLYFLQQRQPPVIPVLQEVPTINSPVREQR